MTDETVPAATAPPPKAAGTARPTISADASLVRTVGHLWPYIWPPDRVDLKLRVVGALVLLVAAKLVTIAVPYSFKWATDALSGKALQAPLPALLAGAIALTIVYGVLRSLMALLTQARDALFAAVSMNAVRRLADEVFVHMHRLSLRFHLERKTGGLTRVLERGRTAIEQIVRLSMLTGVPTVVEFALIIAVVLIQFDWRYVVSVVIMIVVYLGYTTVATNWRIGIRRSMNESDADANTKAIDSLLNYETVKYFGAEEREAQRYDRAMARYEQLSVGSYVSLAVLNAGQAVIFTVGLTVMMVMCVAGIRAGTNTIGDFVLINAMMIQLYQPLNFMGMLYREVKQAIIDIEILFEVLSLDPEIADRPGAQPLVVSKGRLVFENVHFAYDPVRPILKGISFEVPAGKTVAIVGPSGAGKSTISRLIFRFYEPQSGRIAIDGQDIAGVTQTLAARSDRHGAAGHRAVQRHDRLQYPLRTLGCDRGRSRTGGRARPDRRFHPPGAGRLQCPGRRARTEIVGRREAARRDRPDHFEGTADSRARRGDVRARQFHGTRDSARARSRGQGPHDAGHRPPSVDRRQCRRDSRARQGPDRRARPA